MNRLAMMVLKNFFRVPGFYGKLCHYAKHTDVYPEEEKYRHIQKIMKAAVKGGNVELKVYGQENIPTQGGFMFFGNHQGLFDIVAIVATCDTPIAAVFKKELSNIPVLKQFIACSNSFAMDREDVRQSLQIIQKTTQEVINGRSYLIFPEGTRSKKGNEMLEFHGGTFRCATKAKCPVVPIVMIDSFKVLDQKGSKPVTVQIHYLKPIAPEEYEGMRPAELAELVHGRIEETIKQYAVQE